MTPENPPRPSDTWLAGVAGTTLLGLGVARLTLALNPHLAEKAGDLFWLHADFLVFYALAGAVLGGLGAAVVAFLGPHRAKVSAAVAGAVFVAPLGHLLLLPDLGLGSSVLADLIAASGGRRVVLLGLAAAVLLAAGFVLAAALSWLARRLGQPSRRLAGAFVAVGALVLFLAVGPSPPAAAELAGADLELPPADGPPPPRVVLLCVDGADLQVIMPMVAAGELPHFAELMDTGTWGPLETFVPTLSAVVWTSLATGKPAEEHGIHHFLHFRLPGVEQAIHLFPLNAGLNFRLFPLLEKVPGMPVMRAPYTSNMRRAEALWTIVSRRYPVGVYRWLMTWPAEEVDGFFLAGGISWVQFGHEAQVAVEGTLDGKSVYPPDLHLPRPDHPPVPPEALEPYVGAGHEVDPGDPRLKPIVNSFDDPTASQLPELIRRFDARFTAASFYSVDAFHHFFNAARQGGGAFAGAIAERYRFTDARLGELLAALEPDTRVIVVSDHGFDFLKNHHTFAPPGVFFARGPGFDAGRRVDGLSVYDVAPMVLRLLDMPLPEDMPGTRSGTYRRALSRGFADERPETRVASYERPRSETLEGVLNPGDEEAKEVLRSLGYIK